MKRLRVGWVAVEVRRWSWIFWEGRDGEMGEGGEGCVCGDVGDAVDAWVRGVSDF